MNCIRLLRTRDVLFSAVGIGFLLTVVVPWGVVAQSKPISAGTITGIGAPSAPQPLSLASTNGFLYIGTTDGLYVYDVSRPEAPQEVGREDAFPMGAGISRIVLAGRRAYLASVGLRVADISDPARPVTLGYVDNGNGGTNGLAMDVAVSGHHVYLANGGDGMRIYDVSDPYSPTNIGHWPNVPEVFGSFPQGIVVSGDYAFLANYGDGLRVFDVSDPRNPVNVRHVPEPKASRVALEGERLYLLSDKLTVFDVSFPSKPTKLGETADAPSPVAMTVSGNFAYIAASGYNFLGPHMYDVTNPTNITRLSPREDLFNEYPVRDLAISGGYAFLALQFGVSMFNLGAATPPRLDMEFVDSRNVRLAWTAPGWRYSVEGSANPATGWQRVPGEAQRTEGSTNFIIVPRETGNFFYRLKLEQ